MSDKKVKQLSEIISCVSYLMSHMDDADDETTHLFCRCICDYAAGYYKEATGKDFAKTEWEEEPEGGILDENVSNKNERTFLDDLFEGTMDALNNMMTGAEKLYEKWKENKE